MNKAAAPPGVLQSLMSPWALLPSGLGISLLIVAWAFAPGYWKPLGLVAAGCFLLTLVILSVLVLFAGNDPERARARQEFLDGVDALCDKRPQPSREAEHSATAAQLEQT
jgi:hypothetical protein